MLNLFQKGNDQEQQYFASKCEDSIILRSYERDYISANTMRDPITNVELGKVLVFNHLVRVAEQRAYDIQQIDYKDRFTVFNTLENSEEINISKHNVFIKYLQDNSTPFSVRLKILCETIDFTVEEKKLIAYEASSSFDRCYNLVGPERCKACGYNKRNVYE
jgi:hypothetical protein